MSPYFETCDCGSVVTYEKPNCGNCGRFIGAPNVRLARSMRGFLRAHYNQAKAEAHDNGLLVEVERLEAMLNQSLITIAMTPSLLRNLAAGDTYRSYYDALSDDARLIAVRENHAARNKVDAQIHAGYHTSIIHAALSPDGRALTNYGSIAAVLRTGAIRRNCSLLKENDFDFYQSQGLGALDAQEPPGWRAIWEDRALLGVAKLAGELKPGISDEELQDLILFVGDDRSGDRYIEVHIWRSVVTSQIRAVRKAKPDSEGDDIDWDFARQLLEGEVAFEEAGDAHI